MKLIFTDPEEFEQFATAYVLGTKMLRGGGILSADFDPAQLSVGALAEARALIRHSEARAVANDRQHGTAPTETGAQDVRDSNADESGRESDADADVTYEPVRVPDEGGEATDEPQPGVEAPKRKRRTKAQIAADEAAAKAAQEASEQAPLTDEQAAAITPIPGDDQDAADIAELIADHPELAETAPTAPASDKPKHQASAESLAQHATEQAVYTPELVALLNDQAALFDADRKAHLDEGRKAIEQKGFIAYMATFKGLGLDSAIATYSDAQVKLHRAAIAHLLAS